MSKLSQLPSGGSIQDSDQSYWDQAGLSVSQRASAVAAYIISKIGLATNSRLGLAQVDGSTITAVNGILTAISSGSGSIPNSVNIVTDFGADPTGGSDDTTRINNAAASLAGSAGVLIVPGGNYNITGPISVGNTTGGSSAAASFISIYCPAGPNNTTFNWHGSNNSTALMFGKNKYFSVTGLNIQNANSSTGCTGVILGGPGGGVDLGTQTLSGVFILCAVNGWNIGITDGNFGAASEISYISCSINGSTTGWTMNNFNSLDHNFYDLSMGQNAVGVDTGSVENVYIYGGSVSNSSVADFKIGQNASSVKIIGYRSEGAACNVLGYGSGGSVSIDDCLFKDVTAGVSVTGNFSRISIAESKLEGFIYPNQASIISIRDSLVVPDPNTNLPFTIQTGNFSNGFPVQVDIVNNSDGVNSPPISIHDFRGILRDSNTNNTAPFFEGVGYYPTNFINRVGQWNANTSLGQQYGLNWQALSSVRALSEGPIVGAGVPTLQTMTTNAATASGNVLHFSSVPNWVTPGMLVTDTTVGNIPFDSFVIGITSTTVTINANVTSSGVGSGDTIEFASITGIPTPGQNLRVMGTFATSGSLTLNFTRTVPVNTGSGQSNELVAGSGRFFPSDVGKPIKIAGIGQNGWTDWYGVITSYIDSTHVLVNSMPPQTPPYAPSGGGNKTATIGANEPDGNYMVTGIVGTATESFAANSLTSSGFTVTSSNASSTATVTCMLCR